jgi:hypothetical protein
VALAVSYQTVVTANATTSTALYTTSTTGYQRDLVVTNGGASTCFISAGTGVSSASTTVSFGVPTGASLVLTQTQVPNSTILYGFAAATPAGGLSVSIGYASVVSVV